jgi:hypothetical protein
MRAVILALVLVAPAVVGGGAAASSTVGDCDGDGEVGLGEVQASLDGFFAAARAGSDDARRDLQVRSGGTHMLVRYSRSGAVLQRGFGRARCAACGPDFVVAFSCPGGAGSARRAMRDAWWRWRHTWPPFRSDTSPLRQTRS